MLGIVIGEVLIGNQVYNLMTTGTFFAGMGHIDGFNGIEGASQYIDLIYGAVVIAIIFLVIYKNKIPPIKGAAKSKSVMIGLGAIIGLIAGMFGISGGVFIIPAMMIFFGASVKDATLYSLTFAFLTGSIKFVSSLMTVGFMNSLPPGDQLVNVQFALTLAALIIPGVVFGAYFGTK
jgi:uncharacterized membrane protein YfcA